MESRFSVYKPMYFDTSFSFPSLRNTAPGKQPHQTVQRADKISHLCTLLSPVEGRQCFPDRRKNNQHTDSTIGGAKAKGSKFCMGLATAAQQAVHRTRVAKLPVCLQHGTACQGKIAASSSRGSQVFIQLGKVSLHRGELHFSAFALKGNLMSQNVHTRGLSY